MILNWEWLSVVLYFLTSKTLPLYKYIVITREGDLGVTRQSVHNEFRHEGVGREEGVGVSACSRPRTDTVVSNYSSVHQTSCRPFPTPYLPQKTNRRPVNGHHNVQHTTPLHPSTKLNCVLLHTSGHNNFFSTWILFWPVTVAARSKAYTVFSSSNAGILGSNPTQGMDVYVRLFGFCVVLCVGSGLATDWSPVQGVLPTVYRV
jgi:hypothetical protein